MTVKRWIALVMVLSLVAGCTRISESRLNPLNWFGSDEDETAVPVEAENERRPLVPQITGLVIEGHAGGRCRVAAHGAGLAHVDHTRQHRGWAQLLSAGKARSGR